jgi:mannose-6-phosphate isomerase-like protein (cupin superfamily)
MEGETGNMIHSTVPPGQVNRATVHATVSEFWHVLSGEGQIWRRDGTVRRRPFWKQAFPSTFRSGRHSSIAAPVVDPLQFLCITMPRWPGDKEATSSDGPW